MEYGLLGESLRHSFSEEIHSLLGEYSYEIKEISPSELDGFMRKKDFKGINVTIPYKKKVLKYLDDIDPAAEKTGAVNTVVNRNGRLYGYNTDTEGMRLSLLKAGIDPKGKKVLVLGTGGTSETAVYVCEKSGASEIIRVSRSKKPSCVSYSEAAKMHKDADIIINTTPVGMYPDNGSCPLDLALFPRVQGVFDAVYNPLRTRLLLSAEEMGIRNCGGLMMLSVQGVLSAEKFLNKKFPHGTGEKIYKEIYKNKRNIVFIGMPGSGKTTVGRALSVISGREFYDTDELTKEQTGLSPKELLEKYGEAFFREKESEAVKELRCVSSSIIATGGGTVLKKENVRLLRENGVLVFLDRSLDDLSPHENRPLSSTEEALKKIYEERYCLYKSVADHILPANGDISDTVKEAEEMFL